MTRRRTVLTTATIVAVLAAGSTTATMTTSAFADANCAEDLAVVAYLGGAGYAPEQTGAAFRKAVDAGPQKFALNVRLSADGVPVLVGDETLQRVTNVAEVFPDRRNDPVGTFTVDELRQLDAGSWYDEKFAGERIATLHDVLGHVYGNDIGLSLIPKDPAGTPGLIEAIAAEFDSDARWADLLSNRLVQFSSDRIDTLRSLSDRIPGATSQWTPARLPEAGALNENAGWLDEVGQDYRGFTPDDAVLIHEAGMNATLWGVDSPDAVTRALEAGANTIVTDYPDVLNAICAGENPLRHANGITVAGVVPSVPGNDAGPGDSEYVTLTNRTESSIDVSGYYIRSGSGRQLKVGDGYTIPAGGSLRVYTGPGINTDDQYFNGELVNTLNNVADTVAVYNADDDCVAMYAY